MPRRKNSVAARMGPRLGPDQTAEPAREIKTVAVFALQLRRPWLRIRAVVGGHPYHQPCDPAAHRGSLVPSDARKDGPFTKRHGHSRKARKMRIACVIHHGFGDKGDPQS
jgi:hypothetical protein